MISRQPIRVNYGSREFMTRVHRSYTANKPLTVQPDSPIQRDTAIAANLQSECNRPAACSSLQSSGCSGLGQRLSALDQAPWTTLKFRFYAFAPPGSPFIATHCRCLPRNQGSTVQTTESTEPNSTLLKIKFVASSRSRAEV